MSIIYRIVHRPVLHISLINEESQTLYHFWPNEYYAVSDFLLPIKKSRSYNYRVISGEISKAILDILDSFPIASERYNDKQLKHIGLLVNILSSL